MAKKQTCLAECLASTSWMEMKFFKLLDILHPAMVRWPEWRKYLVVFVSEAQTILHGLFYINKKGIERRELSSLWR